jgi:hypothetical protein
LVGVNYNDAVSTFSINVRNRYLFPLNGFTNFKASPTLKKSPFILETSLLTALRELELGEYMGRN